MAQVSLAQFIPNTKMQKYIPNPVEFAPDTMLAPQTALAILTQSLHSQHASPPFQYTPAICLVAYTHQREKNKFRMIM